jgi:tyrosinase
MTQAIPIIGAGIAGLTLSRSLRHRGIPSIIHEKASSKQRFNYAITLHSTAYQPLLKILNLDESTFKRRVAVDAEDDGEGKIGEHVELPSHAGLYSTESSFRANRAKFEQLLREGIDIRWRTTLQSIEKNTQGLSLRFHNTEWSSGSKLVVGADGVHSNVRKLLLPTSSRLDVLPYVAFNGKRRMNRKEFDDIFSGEAVEKRTNVWEAKEGDAVLNISVNEKTSEGVSISWVYSRPIRSNEDALHRPNRSNEDAQKIPEEFFLEVGGLKELNPPFSAIFNVEKVRGDRILHWLMRTTSTPMSDLRDLLMESGVCLIGDATHAEPIVGGNGANAAIMDAMKLADAISSGGKDGVLRWYDERHSKWVQGAEESQKHLARMHVSPVRAGASL